MKKFICENPKCGIEHDGTYGTGRFCSDHCRRVYCGLQTKIHICNWNAHPENHMYTKAPHGTWICKECNIVFETRSEKQKHNKEVHGFGNSGPHNKGGKAWNSGKTMTTDERIAKYAKTNRDNIRSGKTVNPRKGKHLTDEERKSLREATIRYIETTKGPIRVRYNKRSISYFNSLQKERGWNLQHAENGGEFYFDGYWIDGYDKEKNIVVEYDERRHYTDVLNNILIEKDIYRQNYIIEHLHCEFWRYNETTGVLWCVNPKTKI